MSGTTPVLHPLLHLLVALFFLNSYARGRSTHLCERPSSCGNFPNVSYPFRFKGDPDNCGNANYELVRQNNRPMLSLFPGKWYHVKAINYSDHTIRLVDVGVHEGNCSSLPLHSLSVDNFTSDYNIGAGHYKLSSFLWEHTDAALFVACEKPVISPQFVDVNNASRDCSINRDVLVGSSSSHDHDRQRYSYYIVPGDMRAGDLADRCRVDKVFPTMPRLRRGSRDRDINGKNPEPKNNLSLAEVHKKLEYGFLLSWDSILCEDCTGLGRCSFDYGYYKVNCNMRPYTCE
ncbi:hypothetical protein RHGRI_017350 [Rhododendron griersonianum]|uniref:Wall-associated receptor kinase galacturonan-binding domain-containing protein n=1 Tax=Rhododendron griersonianum TaxID=479676 RepID=A0AAV6JXL0_9ERIC|nr:hypothetical protein RHGRI_017350 [Rhododendron griersonianum]